MKAEEIMHKGVEFHQVGRPIANGKDDLTVTSGVGTDFRETTACRMAS